MYDHFIIIIMLNFLKSLFFSWIFCIIWVFFIRNIFQLELFWVISVISVQSKCNELIESWMKLKKYFCFHRICFFIVFCFTLMMNLKKFKWNYTKYWEKSTINTSHTEKKSRYVYGVLSFFSGLTRRLIFLGDVSVTTLHTFL